MTAYSNSDNVIVCDAAMRITMASGRFCGTESARKAAKRLGVYTTDAQGRGVIPETVVKEMARNFATMGYLIRRGQERAE